ncbi:hypothetical protein [Spirosoma lituiforme]
MKKDAPNQGTTIPEDRAKTFAQELKKKLEEHAKAHKIATRLGLLPS